MISAIPTVLITFFGPLRSISSAMFPNIGDLIENIEDDGLVTVANRGDLKALGKYIIWAALVCMIMMTILLLQDNIRMLIVSLVLLGTGTASRLVMGFSPTVYASGTRTFTVMYFCIIAVACYIFSNSVRQGYIDTKAIGRIDRIAEILIICSMINILFFVA